jgi:hypothetical protein
MNIKNNDLIIIVIILVIIYLLYLYNENFVDVNNDSRNKFATKARDAQIIATKNASNNAICFFCCKKYNSLIYIKYL